MGGARAIIGAINSEIMNGWFPSGRGARIGMRSVNRSRLRSTIIRANGYFESISGRTQILHVGFTGECRPLIDPNVTPNGGGSNAIHIFSLITPVKSIPDRTYRFRFDLDFDPSMDTRIREGGEDSTKK